MSFAREPRSALLASLAACALAAGGCQAPVFEVAARAQSLGLDGEIGASTSGAAATSDVESLGLDDSEESFNPRVDLEFGPWHVSGDAFLSSLDGTGEVESDLSFGDVNVTVGQPVSTSVDLGYARALSTLDLLPTTTLDLGIGLGVVFADLDLEAEDLTTSESASASELLVSPVAALHARVHFDRLTLAAAVSGVAFDIDDVDVTHFDVDASASIELFATGGLLALIEGGYRYLRMDVAFEDGGADIDAELDYRGPYAGLRLSF